ncbi:MAG: hypothetical protein ACOY82_12620 [Pseudomonadota bacterium]
MPVSHRFRIAASLALVASIGLLPAIAAAQARRPTLATDIEGPSATLNIDPDARWERVAGCARDLAATGNGIVYVAGCDVGRGGASSVYRWDGAGFSPYPAGGRASAVAAFAGDVHAIGSDALLYSSAGDSVWRRRGTPDGRPITDVGAGEAGLWIVTSRPNGDGGNAIARASACPTADGRLLADEDFCGWQEMPGAAMRISVGTTVWVVTADRAIYEWNASAERWERRPGCFTDVAVGGRHVYAIACERGEGDGGKVMRWRLGGGWIDVRGAGERVAVDAAGNAWVATDNGGIWRLR